MKQADDIINGEHKAHEEYYSTGESIEQARKKQPSIAAAQDNIIEEAVFVVAAIGQSHVAEDLERLMDAVNAYHSVLRQEHRREK